MRYAIFTDIHANLEALEAVLAKIDEIAQQTPIDQIWFLGDLVGYGPNPNECIAKLRERTDVIIAGNHDWAAVGKIDLEDFSEAARLSAEWTAGQLLDENRTFLRELPERIEIDDVTLVHGSPYGPLWEYLTSEVLAERSFGYFTTRFCFVGHTHVPIIFQQPDTIANAPTLPLAGEQNGTTHPAEETVDEPEDADEETVHMVAVHHTLQAAQENDIAIPDPLQAAANVVDIAAKVEQQKADDAPDPAILEEDAADQETVLLTNEEASDSEEEEGEQAEDSPETPEENQTSDASDQDAASEQPSEEEASEDEEEETASTTSPETIQSAEDRMNQEIEELLALLGLSQSMVQVTNEMIVPPEGEWQAAEGHRAIVNPGGVGQPRDGDPRAAFMIYDTEAGITFYRVSYSFEKTQEKVIKAGLPRYLATRLAYGR